MFGRDSGPDISLQLSNLTISGSKVDLKFKTPQLVLEADGEVLKFKDFDASRTASGAYALRSERRTLEFDDVKPGKLSITLRESRMRSLIGQVSDRSTLVLVAEVALRAVGEEEAAQLEVMLQVDGGGATSEDVTLRCTYFFKGLPPKETSQATPSGRGALSVQTTAPANGESKASAAEPAEAPPPAAANDGVDLIIVTVRGCRDLKPPRGTDCDPFVKVEALSETGRAASRVPAQETRVIYDSPTCTWNETFYFPVDGPSNVSFEVFDKNRLRFDVLIGTCLFEINQSWLAAYRSTGQDVWVQLDEPKESGKLRHVGELQLRVRATTFDENPLLPREIDNLPQGAQYDLSAAAEAEKAEDVQSDEELEPDEPSEEQEKKDAELAEENAEDETLRRLLKTRMQEGAYQVQVHVIEVRNLNAEGMDGTSDPMLKVTCFDQTAYSKPQYNCTSCVFDELYTFENADAKRRELETGVVEIDVLSVNTFGKSMIGSFVVNLFNIYAREDHELYRTWVPLIDMTSRKDSGVQGFMRLSIQVLGPGDTPKVHDRVKEKLAMTDKAAAVAGLSGTLAQAMPMLKQTLRFLVVSLYRGEWLPPSDHSLTGAAAGGDFRIGVQFGIHDLVKTKVHSSTKKGRINIKFKERIWIPFMEPSFDNKIRIYLYDNDHLVKDELVASAMVLDVADIKRSPEAYDKVFLNLYGPPGNKGGLSGSASRSMLEYPDTGSSYRGRLYVSLREVGPDQTYDGQAKKGRKLRQQRSFRYKIRHPPNVTPTIDYTVKFSVYMATDLPVYNTGNEFSVALSWGPIGTKLDDLETGRESAHRGGAIWNYETSESGIPFQNYRQALGPVPVRSAEMPDVFVYLVRKDPMHFHETQKIAFTRLSFKSCLFTGDRAALQGPQWLELKRCPVVNNIPSGQPSGSVLVRIALGPTSAFSSIPADNEYLSVDTGKALYKVLVHVFQAQQLPPSDLNGSADPYVVIRFNGQRKRLDHVTKSCDPVYNETVEFDTVMYKESSLKPRVTFDVYDADTWNEDDFIGSVTTPILADEETLDDWNDPTQPWPPVKPAPKSLVLQRNGAPTKGRLLVGFQLVRGTDKPESFGASPLSSPAGRARDAKVSSVMKLQRPLPADYCKPLERMTYVEVIGLGLRDLKASGIRPVQHPALELRLGNQTLTMKPRPGTKSTSSDPNFLSRAVFEAVLPMDATYMPSIGISVRDGVLRGFGFGGSILGSSSISLAPFMPKTIAAEHAADGPPVPEAPGFVYLDNPLFASGGAKARVGNPFRPGAPSGRVHRHSDADTNHHPPADGKESEEEAMRRKLTEAITPSFLKGREVLDHEIELDIGCLPWREYSIYRGTYSLEFLQSKKQTSLEDSVREVGTFKGLIRVLDKHPETTPSEELDHPQLPSAVEDLFRGSAKDRTIHVHLYILQAMRLNAGDTSGRADPYLRIRWGDDVINLRDKAKADTLEPQFFERIDLKVRVPGVSTVWIDVLDADGLGAGGGSVGLGLRDDLIGSTCIDLEDRWFSENWHDMGVDGDAQEVKRPVETRELYTPEEPHSQGALRLWIDMIPASRAREYIPIPISPPQQEEWEVRLIVWKAKFQMRSIGADMVTGMIDMYFKGKLAQQEIQETDTHLRINNGKGSWNWRMKFPVSLPAAVTDEGGGYFHLEAWDVDMLWNEALGATMIDLSNDFQKAYLAKRPYTVFEERAKAKKQRPVDLLRKLDALRDVETGGSAVEEKRSAPNERTPLLSGESDGCHEAPKIEKETLWTRIKSGMGGMGETPPGAEWLKLKKQVKPGADPITVGQVLISIELLPKSVAAVRPAGFGRAEPNSNPPLPQPEGRPDFTKMWNPLYLLQVCLGEGLMLKFCCLFMCLGVLALSFFVGPVFLELLNLALNVPAAGPVLLVALAVFFLACAYTFYRCRQVCCVPEDPYDGEYEDEEMG